MALLFNGTDGAHEYYLDGVLTPSNTTILRDSGLIRFDGVPAAILEAARKRGSAVHALCHFENEGDLDATSIDDVYRPYFDAWLRCKRERAIVPLICERRIASRKHRVTGTLDLLCEIDGDGWLIDYATGNPDHCAKHLQTAGYLGMAFEWKAEDAALAAVLARHQRWRRASVRLCRDGSFRFHEYTDVREYARFQILAAAWHIRQEYGGIVQADDLAA
jgi:hypothetical protein